MVGNVAVLTASPAARSPAAKFVIPSMETSGEHQISRQAIFHFESGKLPRHPPTKFWIICAGFSVRFVINTMCALILNEWTLSAGITPEPQMKKDPYELLRTTKKSCISLQYTFCTASSHWSGVTSFYSSDELDSMKYQTHY